ncbi:hypothetical protein NDU88_006456 [Pleurodeles waltl]|uniref:Uncharacterized protein n=1 Tax=Pleurodeles waltl TaxID=8319 RepID=A0AAV7SPV2_PLEWA|nr:hypothetical protein NDU88_006456 [Pleurodeles waltl]
MRATDQPLAAHRTSSWPHAARSTPSTAQIGSQGYCRQSERCEATGVRPRPPLQQKRTGETKWRLREDARLKAGRQRRTRKLHDNGTVRSHRSTGLRLDPALVPKRRFGRAVRGIGGRNSGGEPGLEVTREKPSGNTRKTSDTSPDSTTSAEEK